MSRTFRYSRRVYQSGDNATISNPLSRETYATGELVAGTELQRRTLVDSNSRFGVAANYLGRLVTLSDTPPRTGSTEDSDGKGLNLHDGWTYRIIGVLSATELLLEGARWEYAATNVTYTIHASMDFSAEVSVSTSKPLTSFAADTGPTGGTTPATGSAGEIGAADADGIAKLFNAVGVTSQHVGSVVEIKVGSTTQNNAGLFTIVGVNGTEVSYINAQATDDISGTVEWELTYPYTRSSPSPVEWQALVFDEIAESDTEHLLAFPWYVTLRGPPDGSTNPTTTLRLSDYYDKFQSITSASLSGISWKLIDPPAYTVEDIYKKIYRFLLQSGWQMSSSNSDFDNTVYGGQHRGRNGGALVGPGRTVEDMILFSEGEDLQKEMWLRMVLVFRNQAIPTGGMDFALWQAWDRFFDHKTQTPTQGNRDDYNLGAGTHAVRACADVTRGEASGALGGTNSSSTNSATDFTFSHSQSSFNTPIHRQTLYGLGQDGLPNFYSNEGGTFQEFPYMFMGDKDEVHIYLDSIQLSGTAHVGLSHLPPAPNANGNAFRTNYSISGGVGPSTLVRIGGSDRLNGEPTYDGIDPANPPNDIPILSGDSFVVCGQHVNDDLDFEDDQSHEGEFIEATNVISLPGLFAARADGAVLAAPNDGDTLTIDDGLGNANSSVVYEWDDNSSGLTVGDVLVDIGVATGNADDVRDALVDSITRATAGTYTWPGGTGATATVLVSDTSDLAVGDYLLVTTDAVIQSNGFDQQAKLWEITAVVANTSVDVSFSSSVTIPSGALTTLVSSHAIYARATAATGAFELIHGRLGGIGNVPIVENSASNFASLEGMGGGGYTVEVASGVVTGTIQNNYLAGARVGEAPQSLATLTPLQNNTGDGQEYFNKESGDSAAGFFLYKEREGNATYFDANPPGSEINESGFPYAIRLQESVSLLNIDPNEASGRYHLVPCFPLMTDHSVRGSFRYFRVASPRLRANSFVRDKEGNVYIIMPSRALTTSGQGEMYRSFVFGPFPSGSIFY